MFLIFGIIKSYFFYHCVENICDKKKCSNFRSYVKKTFRRYTKNRIQINILMRCLFIDIFRKLSMNDDDRNMIEIYLLAAPDIAQLQ